MDGGDGGDGGPGGSGGAVSDSGQSGAGGSAVPGSGGEKSDAGRGTGGLLDGGRESGTDGSAKTPDSGKDSGVPDSGDSGATPKAGFIGVTSRSTEVATVFNNAVGAAFVDGPGTTLPKGCSRQVVGKCATLLCDFTNGGSQTTPTGAPSSAGRITIGGTATAFTLDYDATLMKYAAVPQVPTDHLIFAGGSTITFAAAGQDVPAFADSLVAPTPITVTSPALPLSIDTSKDLVFDWTGSSAGMIAFNVRTATSNSGTTVSSTMVSCQFQASALTGTIPGAILRQLQKTDATTTATLTTDLSSTKEAPAGDYLVHLAVGSLATKADGKTPYTGMVTVL
jgi:hypothetical protein